MNTPKKKQTERINKRMSKKINEQTKKTEWTKNQQEQTKQNGRK